MAPLPDLIGNEIATHTDYYKRTGNPAAAWYVFHLCRKHGRVAPAEINKEIDRFTTEIAKRVEHAIQIPPSKIKLHVSARDIGDIFRDGITNPIGTMQKEWRDYWIFSEVLRRVEEYGEQVGEAQAAVARMKGVSLSFETVDQIWKRLKRDG